MKFACLVVLFLGVMGCYTEPSNNLISVSEGWSNNSVNAVIFRKNSIVSQADTQIVAFYNPKGYLCLGKRHCKDDSFIINKTEYKGNVSDAHNSISIMMDGEGYLHVAWDHHGHPLRYTKSKHPFSLELEEKQPMTGILENNVTYPEFFKMPNGNLLFMYRDGQSGRGNLALKAYDVQSKSWTQLQDKLIDGEGIRNAYWQSCVDKHGVIHISWVWRETPDVASNHDLCYARSKDGGLSWENTKGETYILPITASSAEYACRILQNSELINQTSMTTDEKGNPYIATYWCESGSDIPQYHIVGSDGENWNQINLNFRTTSFSLKGGGTKRIPISRPQIVAKTKNHSTALYLLFRDEERGSKVSMAACEDVRTNQWEISDLTNFSVGSWEPSYDTELWRDHGILNIFVQNVEQIDGEGKADVLPQMIYVLEEDL